MMSPGSIDADVKARPEGRAAAGQSRRRFCTYVAHCAAEHARLAIVRRADARSTISSVAIALQIEQRRQVVVAMAAPAAAATTGLA